VPFETLEMEGNTVVDTNASVTVVVVPSVSITLSMLDGATGAAHISLLRLLVAGDLFVKSDSPAILRVTILCRNAWLSFECTKQMSVRAWPLPSACAA